MLDDQVLDDADLLRRRDESQLLWSLATAGAQVRRAVELRGESGLDRLAGEAPRALIVASDEPPAAALPLLARLACDAAPVLVWHGVELPRWAGPADALLVGAHDGRHPRLAQLADQGVRRGLALAVVAPAGSQVAAAAGRAPVYGLEPNLNPRASRWAILTPLLQALDALELASLPSGLLLRVADVLDETAEACRPSEESFVNAAKSLALEFGETRPVLAGAGPLASLAARVMADALQLWAGVSAVPVGLPDGAGRAGALLRGGADGGGGTADFFRDRVDEADDRRARLLVIGDDGDPDDPALGERSPAQLQLDEIAARRAAAALHRLASDLGVRSSGLEPVEGPALARFAAATAFGDFTAAYLAFALGLDPGAPRPAELAH